MTKQEILEIVQDAIPLSKSEGDARKKMTVLQTYHIGDLSGNRLNSGTIRSQYIFCPEASSWENSNINARRAIHSDQLVFVQVGDDEWDTYQGTDENEGNDPVLCGHFTGLENYLSSMRLPTASAGGLDDAKKSYLAAIRTKPFILLAGISGTGKSRLVRQLARGCCPRYKTGGTTDHPLYNEKKPGNFEIIQVRPNWHDSTELMGYVTRIVKPSEPPKYSLTSFVEFLAKAWTYREIPFFLCLDEMNLAPVEQYFAEYLSVIENREKVKLDEENAEAFEAITTDPLVRWEALERATFDNVISDLFAGKKWADAAQHGRVEQVKRIFKADKGIRIPPNLIVMGTVNMDETTCTFSRKVLDRAMSFELNDVSDMYDVAKIGGEGNCPFGSIAASVAQGSLLTGKDACEADQAKCKSVLEVLELLNEKSVSVAGAGGTEEKRLLAGTPFKIAYRSRNEILIYCIERTKDGVVSLPKALDEALSMKVLSRIEGDNQKVPTQWLELLRKTIDEKLKTLPDFSVDECKTCLDKLRDMAEQSDLGYTSFWTR